MRTGKRAANNEIVITNPASAGLLVDKTKTPDRWRRPIGGRVKTLDRIKRRSAQRNNESSYTVNRERDPEHDAKSQELFVIALLLGY